MTDIFHVELRDQRDVVLARQRARRVAAACGFEAQDQARIATAVSEMARNAITHGRGGKLDFQIPCGAKRELVARVADRGPGIPNLNEILNGSRGAGLVSARRIMDRFEIESSDQGTLITLAKSLPRRAPAWDQDRIAAIERQLAQEEPETVYQEFTAQNQELLHALDEVRQQQTKLAQVNLELEETNRGVVALYADLEEKAAALERVSQQKSRFYSGMSHEFRTPVNSIISLSQILLDKLDGDLSDEQQKQVGLIQRSAKTLLEWITDLLDIAKVEAGRLDVKPTEFVIGEMLGAMRGVMRPLMSNPAVQLHIDIPPEEIVAYTDEGKLTQILRNFLSNAIKFTEAGEIRLTVTHDIQQDLLVLAVSDTGLGIPAEFHEKIFDEFTQVDNRLQQKSRGTGLGLALSKRLAELLSGEVKVESAVGHGSTFTVSVPRIFRKLPIADSDNTGAALSPPANSGIPVVLVIDDDESCRYVVKVTLNQEGIEVTEATNGAEGLALAKSLRPRAIVLDLNLPDMDGYEILSALQADAETKSIPVVLRTSKPSEQIDRQRVLGVIAIISKNPEAGGVYLQQAIRAAGVIGTGGRQ